MSRSLEIFYLPLLFLSVVLFGGMRVVGVRVVLVPPPLFTLVLAFLLVGVLVRSGALAPERLMSAGRSALANISGAIVLLTVFAAATQAFNVATPELGLPRLLFSVFLFVLLLNTLAASPDRSRVLRSLLVIFGSAFVLKFIILAALADPEGGWLKRVLLAMIEGLTLGTLTQTIYAPITGYLAFFVLTLFLIGLALLPPRRLPPTLVSDTSDTSDTTLARRDDVKGGAEGVAGE
jgi:hypothetical protein